MKHIDQPFKNLVKKYLVVFLLLLILYSFFDWIIFIKPHILEINEIYNFFLIPAFVCLLLSFIIFRPLVKKVRFQEDAARWILMLLIPFSLAIPIVLFQNFLEDNSCSLITVDKPTEILKYPNESFFKIRSFVLNKEKYFNYRTSSTYRSTMTLADYYTVPMYNDSTDMINLSRVAYGIQISTQIGNALLDKDNQKQEIDLFHIKSQSEFEHYDFTSSNYFEKQKNNNYQSNYFESWNCNFSFDKSKNPIILVRMDKTLDELVNIKFNRFKYATFICLTMTLIILYLCNVYKIEDK